MKSAPLRHSLPVWTRAHLRLASAARPRFGATERAVWRFGKCGPLASVARRAQKLRRFGGDAREKQPPLLARLFIGK
jgi:hypothetical protein